MDEKMLSLSLYKKCPKCYRMLSTLFTLPSKRTLNALLSIVIISPGICSLVMDVLKENVKKFKPAERYCSILFDEMCLSSGLNYNLSVNIIEGFVDSGTHRNQNFGDHVLVFMVRRIKKKFKQPISYTFCQGATNQYELVRQLIEVIAEIHKTGLTVVATICDQGRPNEDAIQILKNDTRSYYIKNNLPYKDDLYEIEVRKENGNFERLPIDHLFDVRHLMKLTFFGAKSVIDPKAAHTAELFLFFDKLFNSLNGSFHKIMKSKIYQTSVTKKSIHHTLWNDSLKVLSTMKFLGKNEKPVKVPTLTNWITTIKGFQTLSKHLESKGIKSFLPRHLNQDSLESLFGSARSVSCQNSTCSLFISSYKTLLLNNLVLSHSLGSNCEEFTESSLLTYKNLFSFSQENPAQPLLLSCDLPKKVSPYTDKITQDLKLLTHTYIVGFIIKN